MTDTTAVLAADLAETLRATTEEANPAIQDVRAELQRAQDVAAERLRRLNARDEIDRRSRERIAAALGMEPVPRSWDIIAAEVERRLGEGAAEIERLRYQIVDDTRNAQMGEVHLPELKEASNG